MTAAENHPAVQESARYIDAIAQLVEDGSMPRSMGQAIISTDLLGTSIALSAERPDVAALLMGWAGEFAWCRRSEAIAAGAVVPDDISGLDTDG